MAKNPESDDPAKTGGPISPNMDPTASETIAQRIDGPHASAPSRPNFLSARTSVPSQKVTSSHSVSGSVPSPSVATGPTSSFDSDADYLPPKLRQRMQALMAELSLEVEPPSVSLSEPESTEETPAEFSTHQAEEIEICENVEALVVPEPGELVEIPSLDSDDSIFDDIDPEELATLGIETHPLENPHPVANTGGSESESLAADIAGPSSTIPFREITETPPETEMVLETSKYLDPLTLIDYGADGEPENDSNDPSVGALEQQEELASTTETFSQQAGEIVEILKQRQSELSRYREQLEMGKAKAENELRQQRLELVEKKREFLEEVSQFRKSQKKQTAETAAATQAEVRAPAVQIRSTSSPLRVVRSPKETTVSVPAASVSTTGRRITLDSIAMPAENGWPGQEIQATPKDASGDHLDRDFLEALERHLGNPPVAKSLEPDFTPPQQQSDRVSGTSLPEARLKQQAASLKKQHTAAIGSLQKTRRQLELLRNVVVQQQKQTAERACDLDLEHEHWNTTRSHQQQELEVDRRELDRLTSIRENELSKRETATLQRENAVKQLESKLQQAQVEILRDRVIIRQLERTARQTLSNAQWNDRLAIITEETDGYLQSMKDRADAMKVEASQQIKRLDSRQSELLLYRESLRNWVQRQMKLISRRSAHLEEREDLIQQRWQAIAEARVELQDQQNSLNEILRGGLEQIDDQLETPPRSRIQDAA